MPHKSHVKTKHRRPKRTRSNDNAGRSEPTMQVGVAWFRPNEYAHLLEISVDAASRHDTYLEWLDNALEHLARLRAMGMNMVKVEVDVKEFEQWCYAQGRAVDGKACAEFVSSRLASGEAVILP